MYYSVNKYIIMEETDSRLTSLMTSINLLYIECQEKRTLPKKVEAYSKGMAMINEAKILIEALQNEIIRLDTMKVDPKQMGQIDKLIDIVSLPGISFPELMGAVIQFKQISSGLPTEPQVTDHIEKQSVIYEEDDLEM